MLADRADGKGKRSDAQTLSSLSLFKANLEKIKLGGARRRLVFDHLDKVNEQLCFLPVMRHFPWKAIEQSGDLIAG